MLNLAVLIGVIVVLGMLFISYSYGAKECELGLLRGFWEADRGFCDESGLQMFSMYMGKRRDGVYPCYLLMVDNEDTILINEAACFSLNEPLSNIVSTNDCREFYIRFDGLETDLMPCNAILKYYASTGKIVLADQDKIYAVLFKNPVLTELERISKEKSLESNTVDTNNDSNTVECTESDAETL